MPHPFANAQLAHSLSRLSIVSSFVQDAPRADSKTTLISESTVPDPSKALPRLHPTRSRPSLHTSYAVSLPTERFAQFVARNSKVTLLLDAQDANAPMPVYCCGNTIDGVIAIGRASSLLALDVKVQGMVKLHDYGEDNTSWTNILDATVISWDTVEDGPFPSKVSFRYTIPECYLDDDSNKRYRLPPSYRAELPGFPGFDVEVSYRILISMFRVRDRLTFWRKNSILNVPFLLHHDTRPPTPGRFPPNDAASTSGPQTLFTYKIKTQDPRQSDIQAHIFLPLSQIFTIEDSVPFTITLSGPDAALEPFKLHRPTLSSFLPLAPTTRVRSHTSTVEAQLRGADHGAPVCLRLQRTTVVDTRHTRVPLGTEKKHIRHSRVVGTGVVHRSTEGRNSMTWSGTILVEPGLTCGGFDTGKLRVQDSIVLSVNARDASGRVKTVSSSIPVHLATRRYDCASAVPLSDRP